MAHALVRAVSRLISTPSLDLSSHRQECLGSIAAVPVHHIPCTRIYLLSFASFATLNEMRWFSPSRTLKRLEMEAFWDRSHKFRVGNPDSVGSFRNFGVGSNARRSARSIGGRLILTSAGRARLFVQPSYAPNYRAVTAGSGFKIVCADLF